MTSPSPDPDVPDIDANEAAVHAVLDGEAGPEQRRMVARDPSLRARLADLQAVAAAVAADVDEPDADAYDTIRARALAALEPDAAGDAADDEEATAAPLSPPPADDEESGRGRVVPLAPHRRRRLPPLPAVAAAVAVLLAIGAGLILTDRGAGEQRADKTVAASDAAEEGSQATTKSDGAEAPGDARDQALPEASASFNDQPVPNFAGDGALKEALGKVDATTLADLPLKAGRPPGATEPSGSEASTTTSSDSQDNLRISGAAARNFAESNEVQRCSDVLEASDPDIQPVQAAVPVLVDGERLLVLSNPVKASADDPASIRLSVVEPMSCFPRIVVAHEPDG